MSEIAHLLWLLPKDILPTKQSKQTKGVKMDELTYHEENGFLYPDLLMDMQTQPIGKYGLLRRDYLMTQRPIVFTNLITTGKLQDHLAEVDSQAKERVEAIVSRRAQALGIDEQMKESNQMGWIGAINNLKSAAEETVVRELVLT
jgi:hypothetical protein